jgi:uncharacterized protein (DUF58 family)
LHKSPFHGFSVEFAEHRLYNTGESTKHLDWKLYGRSDKLFVKRYEEETNLRCQLVIDASGSMYFPEPDSKHPEKQNKISFSAHAAAALTYLLRNQRDAVGLSVFSDKVTVQTPCKSSMVHGKLIFSELEKLLVPFTEEQRKRTFAVNALHEIAENIHKRSLVILFSDMMDSSKSNDELFAALQHLRHNKHEVILFHVSDKSKELEFEFENRPYNFIDMETGEELKVHPHEIKESYLKAINTYTRELKMKCGQYRIEFVEADINAGFNTILSSYLIKRSKLI